MVLLFLQCSHTQVKTGIRGNLAHGNKLTNREILAAMDVTENMLPYVYDTFKWDHCLEAGYDFDEAYVTRTEEQQKADNTKSSTRPSLTGGAPQSAASFRGTRKASRKSNNGKGQA